jgi:hypothetical protein
MLGKGREMMNKMQKKLDGILLPRYTSKGFTVRESDDHVIHIVWYGILQSTFTQNTTAEQLNLECQRLLDAE